MEIGKEVEIGKEEKRQSEVAGQAGTSEKF